MNILLILLSILLFFSLLLFRLSNPLAFVSVGTSVPFGLDFRVSIPILLDTCLVPGSGTVVATMTNGKAVVADDMELRTR